METDTGVSETNCTNNIATVNVIFQNVIRFTTQRPEKKKSTITFQFAHSLHSWESKVY